MRVLFIGNSHTYMNALPYMVREMIRSRRGADACEVWSVTVGGRSLLWHAAEPGTQQVLRMFEWDYVVLQQQTHPFGGHAELAGGYEKLLPHLEASGAEVLLYVTWKQKNAPVEEQDRISAAFERLAEERSLRLVPVGGAWARARAEHPDIELYTDDESHAAPAGSYLAACTFFPVLTGDSPVGLPARLACRDEVLVDLDPRAAAALQSAAQRVTACAPG
jgi:Domain of unknown function (DUF4886)